MFLRHFDLNQVLVTEQGFEGMGAKRLGVEGGEGVGVGGGDGTGGMEGVGREVVEKRD